MRYNYKYFKDSLPEWKRKKDPIVSRIFYRRISFFTAAFCANIGITANTVSYASIIVALISCILFLVDKHVAVIAAGVLINVWLIMDCTDGNLARSVKKQPFGEFADGISSYILVGFMCTCMGFSAYQMGGVLFDAGSPWIILFGALASSSDTMMRLIYHKYKESALDLVDKNKGKKDDKQLEPTSMKNSYVRLKIEFGPGGILPLLVLLGTIFNAVDLVVIYCFLYNGLSGVAASLIYIRKAIKQTKEYEKDSDL